MKLAPLERVKILKKKNPKCIKHAYMELYLHFFPYFFDERTTSKLAFGLQLISIYRKRVNEKFKKQTAGATLSFSS
jgi:hypothetical protein